MAFQRPTISQIKDRIQSDLKTGLGLTTILARSFLAVLSAAYAGASHTLHGYISWALKQLLPDSSDDEYTVRWAKIFGIDRLEATFAEIEVTITGTDGVPVPNTTLWQRSDGVEYKVKTEVTPSGGTVTGTLVCQTPGDTGNISNGSQLNITSPIAGINSQCTVTATTVEGSDQETIENLRTRLLERIKNPPAGGTVADYIAFAKTVNGVTRVWVLPGHLGQGTVGVTFVMDGEDPIIPSLAKVDEVQAAVLERCPVEADAVVFAPTATPINPTIKITPNTQAVRDAVTAELLDLVFREAQVRDAVDPALVAEGTQYTGRIPLSKINEAISIAAGENDHELVSPSETPQPPTGGILTLGTITFQTLV